MLVVMKMCKTVTRTSAELLPPNGVVWRSLGSGCHSTRLRERGKMKITRQKHAKRVLKFYHINFDLHPPFKVLGMLCVRECV
mgnify:CR=1 FL=1